MRNTQLLRLLSVNGVNLIEAASRKNSDDTKQKKNTLHK